jgi:hypothetical protein
MIPLDHVAAGQIRMQALKDSLTISDPRVRTEVALGALSWDRPEAQVEWAPLAHDIGRFTVGSFPTSASVVAAPEPARLAWLGGFRWCVSVEQGAVEWFDLKHRLRWRGTAGTLNVRTLAGLTARSFAHSGYFMPQEVTFEPLADDISSDPSRRVAIEIKQWWNLSCQRHLSEESTPEEKSGHKDRFTRFVAGILLLRTIEDMRYVSWLPHGCLRDAIGGRAPAGKLSEVIMRAATGLNSRVLKSMARALHADVKRAIIVGSYDLHIDFAALDVDPVGAFYEEILGIEYDHTAKPQRHLFGEDLETTEDRNARRDQGVYYTPRVYADTLARKLVRPAIRSAEKVEELPVVADIAAGSGELLCAALREFLAEPMWHAADVAWEVLNTKLQAVDRNPLALQLCALNLLRTAIRRVPSLLDGTRLFPPLDANLKAGDALLKSTIDGLPRPDIVLINPPFQTPNRWKPPDKRTAIPELAEVDAHPNRAIAFFAAAIRLGRPGAGLGVVMPSSLFDGPQSARWRRWLAEKVNFHLVAANYGTPFRDTHSRAGLVVAQKRTSEKQWRPRARIVRISGAVDPDRDIGTLLSEEGDDDAAVLKLIAPPIDERSPDWLGPQTHARDVGGRRRALQEVMGGQFHQGVVLAAKPWKSGLFLFEKLPGGKLKHLYTGRVVGPLVSPRLRPFVNAKKVSKRVPLWCEPVVDHLWVFVPPGGGAAWVSVDALQQEDPGGWHIGALPEVLRARAPLELVRPRGDLGLIKKLCARLNDKDVPRQIDEMNELEGKIDVRDLGARQEIPDVGSGVEIHSLAPGKTARARLAQAVDTKSAHRMSMNLEQIRNDVSLVLWLHVFGRTLLLSGEVLRLRIVALRLDAQNQLLQFHDRRREFVHADREAPPIRPVRGRLLRLPLHRPRLQQPAHPRSPRAAGRLVHRARRPGSWS